MLTQKKIDIVEVGPRDGLQNVSQLISADDKIEYIKLLAESGIQSIEVASFVRSEKIPQMKDAPKIVESILNDESLKKIDLSCLVPNQKGLQSALDLGVKSIAVFTSTSETFNQKNINSTIEESLKKIQKVLDVANDNHLKIRGYISTVFNCPYEGKTSKDHLKRIIDFYLKNGIHEISLGDTLGSATPFDVSELIQDHLKNYSLDLFSMHFHDTYGMAIANAFRSYQLGINRFDSSSGGLGGCPYAKGAAGNLATEELVYLFESHGVKTGIDIQKLRKASLFIYSKLARPFRSKYLEAIFSSNEKDKEKK